MAIFVDAFYLVLDAIVITLGLLFVWKWGKSGLLAMTMWLLVVGLMAYAVGDALFLAGTDLGYKTAVFSGSAYEMESADFAFIAAVILWIVAFAIPVKFAFFDAKKPRPASQGPAQPAAPPPAPQQQMAQPQAPPQQPPMMPQQAQMHPQQQYPAPAPPQYQQAPQQYQQQAPPPPYQQRPPGM